MNLNDNSNADFIERIENFKTTASSSYKFIGLSPCALLTINTNQTKIAAHDNYLVLVYNEKLESYDMNLQLVRKIDKINNKKLNCCMAATNNQDKIYLCEYNSHKIKIIDYRFNQLNEPFNDSKQQKISNRLTSNEYTGFYYPYDMCFQNNCLYVCDLSNRIIKLTQNLEYEFEFKVDFQIRQMIILNQVICLNTFNYDKIYFLNVNTFQLMNFYENRHGPLCTLDDKYLYEFSKNGEYIYCYDTTIESTTTNYCVNLISKIKPKFKQYISFSNNVCMKRFFNKIIITSSCGKLLSV